MTFGTHSEQESDCSAVNLNVRQQLRVCEKRNPDRGQLV